MIAAAAMIKTETPILIRYAKPCSQWCIINQAIGKAMSSAIITSFKKSMDNMAVILFMDAPITFLILISFLPFLCSKCSQAKKPKT